MEDRRDQLQQFINVGGVSGFQSMLPTAELQSAKLKDVDEDFCRKQCVIIDSMTYQERHFPDKINQSRKVRIAKGSGTSVQDVSITIRQYKKMEKQMKQTGRKARALKNFATIMDSGPKV